MAFEFHISRAARAHYEFDRALFQTTGNVILPDFPASRAFARLMNEKADRERHPDRVVHAAELNAMGLIDEILHHAIEIYRRTVNPQVMAEALATLEGDLGLDRVDGALLAFVEQFPPLAVFRKGRPAAEYLAGVSEGMPNRQIVLEELLLLWLANVNPAFATFDELFDDALLSDETDYPRLMEGLRTFFAEQPTFGPEGLSLLSFLRSPGLAEPESLAGQLRYMRSRWGLVLTPFLDRLIVTLDVLHEEEVALWMRMHPAAEPAVTVGPGLGGLENEYERFSADSDWMPRVVLMAKTTFVWLDQLSKQYGRWIRRLDEIPDEELDTLARRGFTGLWLIGLWERSPASQKIKQWRGNPEAAASAYSLMDYAVAEDLGGDEAFRNLRDRCWARGIRLSSDMVPNHMGLDSRWVIEHPDWFVQLPEPPYPAYSFSGGDLCDDDRVAIQIEDHYWNSTDAAVVFKRTDKLTGDARYIYHGNDGTSMPWNDTAQLDFLQAEVREAVIQTILHVARQFPIIRFDAAMTLARRHIQRLWYPEPGQGGAIPSRAEHAISRAVFDERMPAEFWREVVDRVAAEVPDTLLLAEAFWLLEGYFVRTLGMHRVYNSAFMNMLRDEENANYRRVIKDTLEFDPEVLKRFVNFMNNPDERTAIDQFGKGDKYFGVATLLATMPGLPMIGHGQLEGFAEKYGMEYRRAYRDEQPDEGLVERHERELFPLFHRRHLFAEATDFLLYDVFAPAGWVNEDVFAYSNGRGQERALIVYNNKYAEAKGWIKTSTAYSEADGSGGRRLVQRSLGEGLGLHAEGDFYTLLREQRSGLEYIRRSSVLCRDGLYVELHAYGCQVFLDIHELHDGPSGQLRRLSEKLGGRGVPNVGAAMREMQLEPLRAALGELAEPGAVAPPPAEAGAGRGAKAKAGAGRARAGATGAGRAAAAAPAGDAAAGIAAVLRAVAEVTGSAADVDRAAAAFGTRLAAALRMLDAAADRLGPEAADPDKRRTLVAGLAVEAAASIGDTDELALCPVIAEALAGPESAAVATALHRLPLVSSVAKLPAAEQAPALARALAADDTVRTAIGVNLWEGETWFDRDAFRGLLWWLPVLDALPILDEPATPAKSATAATSADPAVSVERLALAVSLEAALLRAADECGYRLDGLEEATRRASS